MPNQSTQYSDRLAILRAGLLEHSVYSEVDSVADLRRFMEDHVFAVWDFMSLLKRLQQDLTCTKVPWFPVDNTRAARLINDIVAGEETDVDPDGSYVSHLDLYLRAMAVAGANHGNDPLRHFIYYIERHIELDGDSHGPMGRELLEGLVADSPQRHERALRAACNSIEARIELWNGTLGTLREMRAA
jgi:hypothetical protein